MMHVFNSFFLGGLLSLLTIVNPLTKIPLFITLTQGMDERERRAQARRACFYAAALLTGSLFAGTLVLATFGISFSALRIAGGLVVATIGHRMLFREREALTATGRRGNIAFFPLAMPGISGPGSIAVMIGISTELHEIAALPQQAAAYAATLLAVIATCVATWLTLRFSESISRRVGEDGMEAFSRLMGFLLICVGVQFVGSGIKSFAAGA
jgi:multiple antibiotic resistance protein